MNGFLGGGLKMPLAEGWVGGRDPTGDKPQQARFGGVKDHCFEGGIPWDMQLC